MSHLGRLVGYFHVFSWQNPVKEKTVSEVGVNPEISRDTLERLGVIYALQSTCLSCQSWRTALAWNVTLAIGCDRGGGGLSLLSESNFYCSFLFFNFVYGKNCQQVWKTIRLLHRLLLLLALSMRFNRWIIRPSSNVRQRDRKIASWWNSFILILILCSRIMSFKRSILRSLPNRAFLIVRFIEKKKKQRHLIENNRYVLLF